MSACTGACLEKWPAVEPVAVNDTKGIKKKGYMNFTRPDGVKQQTSTAGRSTPSPVTRAR